MPKRTETNDLLKILVIEDHLPTLELMTEVLRSSDVMVHAVSDSEQVSGLVDSQRFDGIFLDLMMPKLDGFGVARQIRQSPWNKSTPIVIVTGSDDRKTIDEAFAAGGSFFLRKPIDRQRLTKLLNTSRGAMLESRRRLIRVPISMLVTCHIGADSIAAKSQNLSEKGMLFEAGHRLEKGQKVELSFQLPDSLPKMRLAGIVSRVDGQLAGVSFLSLNAADRQRLRILIATCLERKP